MKEIVGKPTDAINAIGENAYSVKVKRLACSETSFMPYSGYRILDKTVYINGSEFPLDLIEEITVRYKESEDGEVTKWEETYKVDSSYFRQFLSGKAINKLINFGVMRNQYRLEYEGYTVNICWSRDNSMYTGEAPGVLGDLTLCGESITDVVNLLQGSIDKRLKPHEDNCEMHCSV